MQLTHKSHGRRKFWIYYLWTVTRLLKQKHRSAHALGSKCSCLTRFSLLWKVFFFPEVSFVDIDAGEKKSHSLRLFDLTKQGSTSRLSSHLPRASQLLLCDAEQNKQEPNPLLSSLERWERFFKPMLLGRKGIKFGGILVGCAVKGLWYITQKLLWERSSSTVTFVGACGALAHILAHWNENC